MSVNQRSSIVMGEAEIAQFIEGVRSATVATIGPGGKPHLVAMWFAVIGGEIFIETKAKSQKVLNLRRDPSISVLMEDGATYDELRGVAIEGTGEIIEDPDLLWQVGVSVYERYTAPYSETAKPTVEQMLNKRVAVRLRPQRIRSWDHAKLGMPSRGEPAGSTATASGRRRR
jgi:PPOX class probable F420-dependent enzyme